ncbi:MAG: hypothetical protein RL205_283 [Actinomycetota bacterium]|jgi:hypothetical protein
MMAMFREYRGDSAAVVTEDGIALTVAREMIAAAGLRDLRTGQRLVLTLDPDGHVVSIRLP